MYLVRIFHFPAIQDFTKAATAFLRHKMVKGSVAYDPSTYGYSTAGESLLYRRPFPLNLCLSHLPVGMSCTFSTVRKSDRLLVPEDLRSHDIPLY